MDTNQIAFIICTNNEQYYDECVCYIQELYVPAGYSIDIICIQEADSMAQGYNAGMQASGAKYKVYLHQDTFILNRNFIFDILTIFGKNENVGMIGVIGAQDLSSDANCYLKWSIGAVDVYNGRCIDEWKFNQEESKEFTQVRAIAGLIMITQYDVPWREDILDGWDFYDISQCLEMEREGYTVVVPYQKEPWCYHDCGVSNRQTYDKYRRKIIEEYLDVFTEQIDAGQSENKLQEIQVAEKVRKTLIHLVDIGDYATIQTIIVREEMKELWLEDTSVREIVNLMEIYAMEEGSLDGVHSDWFKLKSWEQMYVYYRLVRFTILRIANGREDERIEELKRLLKVGSVSKDAIRKISGIMVKDATEVYRQLLKREQEEPLVSIVVAVYNGALTIGNTLQSILNQTYQNMEIIVVDDASTDNSREIISSFSDSRIKKVFLGKNRHICYAGNVGFQKAQGKYVALIGHDDLWRKDKLEKQVAFLEDHPSYSVCFTWTHIIDEDNRDVSKKYQNLNDRFCGDNLDQEQWSRKMILCGNQFCAPSACIRREYLIKTGYYRYGLVQLQDYDLWIRLLDEGPVYVLQEKLTYYRQFEKKRNNLSAVNMETRNRGRHEIQWILDNYIGNLPSEKFRKIFYKEMKNPSECGEKEILCEKVLFLWNMRNCLAEKRFIDLLEDEECRDILERKYKFYLPDFYRLNAQPMLFDSALLQKVKEQERIIENYCQQHRGK